MLTDETVVRCVHAHVQVHKDKTTQEKKKSKIYICSFFSPFTLIRVAVVEEKNKHHNPPSPPSFAFSSSLFQKATRINHNQWRLGAAVRSRASGVTCSCLQIDKSRARCASPSLLPCLPATRAPRVTLLICHPEASCGPSARHVLLIHTSQSNFYGEPPPKRSARLLQRHFVCRPKKIF